ncbi:MAG: hypothetical protein PHV16_01675 [Candidatus Nanoarchaeia archaeon]|nr:hypothetical protein [Candidatus Nanoarchaeia archaeon]
MKKFAIYSSFPNKENEISFTNKNPLIRLPKKKTIDEIVNSIEFTCKEIQEYELKETNVKSNGLTSTVVISDKFALENQFLKTIHSLQKGCIKSYIFKFPESIKEFDYFTVVVCREYYPFGCSDTGNQENLYLGKDKEFIEIIEKIGENLYKKKVGFCVSERVREYYRKKLDKKF